MNYFRLVIFLAGFLFTSCQLSRPGINCSKFKTGKFEIQSKVNNSYSIIERSEKIQIETNSVTGDIVTANIKWTSQCEYELLYKTQTRNSNDSIIPFLQSRPVKFKILNATDDYYIFEGSVDSVDFKFVDTIRVFRPR